MLSFGKVRAVIRSRRWRAYPAFFLIMLLAATTVVPMAIQVTGWGYMILKALPDQSFSDAVTLTFSGDAPCEFCEVSQQLSTRSNDETPSALSSAATLEMPKKLECASLHIFGPPHGSGWAITRTDTMKSCDPSQPETPPG